MSDWAAVKEIDGVTLKARVPVRALSQLTALAQTMMGGPEPELSDVASAMVWSWDKSEDCDWRKLDNWLSESVPRLVAFEEFLSEVAVDFFLRSRGSSETLMEKRPDLKEALERLTARLLKQSEELEKDMQAAKERATS